jgi:radical SAM protein with 4Fe4S-binding SPASM domain
VTDCSVPTIPYSEFGVKLQKIGRFAMGGTFEITPRCNLKCVHCYVAHCDWPLDILTFDEISKIIDDLVNQGCLWISLTGGEPLVRPDFIDIYTYAKKKGLLVNLLTNGTLITPKIVDHLGIYTPRVVEISLYGATKQIYEKVTGVPGSFEQCLYSIGLLMERHIPLRLKTVALTVNKDEMKQMHELAQKLGVPFRFDPGIMPRLDHNSTSISYRLSPEEVVELESCFPERIDALETYYKKFYGPRDSDRSYACGAGNYSFFIDPYGCMSVCLSSRSPSYNLRRGNFDEAWRVFIPETKARKIKNESKCRHCELVSVCDRCPALAELETGDPDAVVEWICKLTHLRASRFGIKVS